MQDPKDLFHLLFLGILVQVCKKHVAALHWLANARPMCQLGLKWSQRRSWCMDQCFFVMQRLKLAWSFRVFWKVKLGDRVRTKSKGYNSQSWCPVYQTVSTCTYVGSYLCHIWSLECLEGSIILSAVPVQKIKMVPTQSSLYTQPRSLLCVVLSDPGTWASAICRVPKRHYWPETIWGMCHRLNISFAFGGTCCLTSKCNLSSAPIILLWTALWVLNLLIFVCFGMHWFTTKK